MAGCGGRRRARSAAAALTVAVTADADADALVADIAEEVARFGTTKHLSSDRVDRVLNRERSRRRPPTRRGSPPCRVHARSRCRQRPRRVADRPGDDGVDPSGAAPGRPGGRGVLTEPDAATSATASRRSSRCSTASNTSPRCSPCCTRDRRSARGTAALAARWGVDDVVHVREGSPDDVARLARLASGHGYGLVLSGGGARGFAHLGVVRALAENGRADRRGRRVLDGLGDRQRRSPRSPRRGTARARRAAVPPFARLHGAGRVADQGATDQPQHRQTLGDWDIEDLWLPFFCVSTNLTKSQLQVHRRGNASLAVRASVAIPGVLPPVPSTATCSSTAACSTTCRSRRSATTAPSRR